MLVYVRWAWAGVQTGLGEGEEVRTARSRDEDSGCRWGAYMMCTYVSLLSSFSPIGLLA